MAVSFFSSTDRAIAEAHKAGTLRLVDREGRFGAFVSIEDAAGVIEVADDRAAAEARVAGCCA